MKRRTFLSGLGCALPLWAASQRNGRLKIAAVELVEITGHRETETGVNRQYQVNPLYVYDDYRPPVYKDAAPETKTAAVTAIYIRIRTDAGLDGLYGPIDREAAMVVAQQLRPFVTGKDTLAGEALWDQMYRSN